MSCVDLPDPPAAGPFHNVCAAVATPPGQSGLAVIRMSGEHCAEAARLIFRPAGGNFPEADRMPGYTCAVGLAVDPVSQAVIDQVVLTRFVAPHSFTGEDVIEISCHGGTAVKQAILDGLFRLGVRPAEAGEFTRRAFLNGKMDLVQAEAVMDLIQAGARKASHAAAVQLQGALSRRIRQFSDADYRILAQVELILEYPEHEESPAALASLEHQLLDLRRQLQALADSFHQGRLLREGLTVVIAGRPNTGKSSLLNALAGFDRAIVTPIPGTTRDTVEELVEIAGLPVRLVDTAGLRETEDLVERIGVERAKSALQSADLVFWLVSPPLDDLAVELAEVRQIPGLPLILIAGKDDLAESQAVQQFFASHLPDYPVVPFSALTGEGLEQLRQAILDRYSQAGSTSGEEALITNSRHKACLDQALLHLDQAQEALRAGIPLDLVASLLRASAESLAGITGDVVSDELIDTIFSRFCIGK